MENNLEVCVHCSHEIRPVSYRTIAKVTFYQCPNCKKSLFGLTANGERRPYNSEADKEKADDN